MRFALTLALTLFALSSFPSTAEARKPRESHVLACAAMVGAPCQAKLRAWPEIKLAWQLRRAL